MYWWRKAAEQGEYWSQFELAKSYDRGDGIPENDLTAVYWYRRAAEQGHTFAMNNLGEMYDQGHGVPEDDVKVYAWFSVAALGLIWWGRANQAGNQQATK